MRHVKCPTCNGSGEFMGRWNTVLGGTATRCTTCFGRKQVPYNHPLLYRPNRRPAPKQEEKSPPKTIDFNAELAGIDFDLPQQKEPLLETKYTEGQGWKRTDQVHAVNCRCISCSGGRSGAYVEGKVRRKRRTVPYVLAAILIFTALAIVFAIATEQEFRFINEAFQTVQGQIKVVRSAYE